MRCLKIPSSYLTAPGNQPLSTHRFCRRPFFLFLRCPKDDHDALVRRIVSQITRVGGKPPILFAGGAARNPCLRGLVEERTECEVFVPESPQTIGALGAALLAAG